MPGKIDVHQHLLPPRYFEALAAAGGRMMGSGAGPGPRRRLWLAGRRNGIRGLRATGRRPGRIRGPSMAG